MSVLLEARAQHAEVDAAVIKNGLQQPFRLLCQREQRVQRCDFLMVAQGRNLLCALQRRERPRRIFFFSHDDSLPCSKLSCGFPCF